MREIKFRAYIKWANIIIQVSKIEFDRKRVYGTNIKGKNNPCDSYCLDDVVLLQYTGLKDINKVEIYEGDILQLELDWGYGTAKILNKVYFENGCFKAKAINSHEDVILVELPTYEIIGNIYENPELLKDIK